MILIGIRWEREDMKIIIVNRSNFYKIFNYWKEISKDIPYFYQVDIEGLKTCFFEDSYEGEKMFDYIETYLVEEDKEVLGFIQFGQPHIYFDTTGEKLYSPNIGIIRNIYFNEGRADAGNLLIKKAQENFSNNKFDSYFAFNHSLGLSCNARHGKLHESKIYIADLLKEYGYHIEHENIYYSIDLTEIGEDSSYLCDASAYKDIKLIKNGVSKYNKEIIDLVYKNEKVGEVKILYLNKINTAYVNVIWIDDNHRSKGLGGKFIRVISKDLIDNGFTRMDLDTAKNNISAQRFYDRNGFTNRGITRSYMRDGEEI